MAAVNGQYVLADIDGNVMKYDGATGLWLSTTDRWGNALTASYDNSGALLGVTDSEGRTITFTYGGGGVASVALPTGETWRASSTTASRCGRPNPRLLRNEVGIQPPT